MEYSTKFEDWNTSYFYNLSMENILLWFIFGIVLAVIGVIFAPLIPLLILKYQLGEAAALRFFPILGELYYFGKSETEHKDSLEFMKLILRDPKKKVILTNIFIWPSLLVLDHHYIKQILVEHHNYTKLKLIADTRFLDRGLLFSAGQRWKKQRNLVTRAFTFENLKKLVPVVNELSIQQFKDIEKREFNPFQNLASITGEAVIRSFFDNDLQGATMNGKPIQIELGDLIGDLASVLRHNIKFMIGFRLIGQKIWNFVSGPQYKSLQKRGDDLLELFNRVVQERYQKKLEYYKSRPTIDQSDFLDIFLNEYVNQDPKASDPMVFEEIVQQFITFFQAGTDNTALTVSLMLFYLCKDPSAQDELREEVQQIMGDRTQVEYEDLQKFVKMNAFMKEALRVRSPTRGLLPRRAIHGHYLKDIFIKQGWFVGFYQSASQSREIYYDNAKEFQWKRWLGENPIKWADDQGFIHAPFSAGGRNCIGQHLARMEIIVMLSQLLKNFKFTIDESIPIKWQFKFLYTFEPQTAIKPSKL